MIYISVSTTLILKSSFSSGSSAVSSSYERLAVVYIWPHSAGLYRVREDSCNSRFVSSRLEESDRATYSKGSPLLYIDLLLEENAQN